MVIATTAIAADARRAVEVEYEELPPSDAQVLAPDAPMIRPNADEVGHGPRTASQPYLHLGAGDQGRDRMRCRQPSHGAGGNPQSRVHPVPWRPAAARLVPQAHRQLTVYMTSQARICAHRARDAVRIRKANPRHRRRIGGGFAQGADLSGLRLASCLDRDRRAVKWIESRIENISHTGFAPTITAAATRGDQGRTHPRPALHRAGRSRPRSIPCFGPPTAGGCFHLHGLRHSHAYLPGRPVYTNKRRRLPIAARCASPKRFT